MSRKESTCVKITSSQENWFNIGFPFYIHMVIYSDMCFEINLDNPLFFVLNFSLQKIRTLALAKIIDQWPPNLNISLENSFSQIKVIASVLQTSRATVAV